MLKTCCFSLTKAACPSYNKRYCSIKNNMSPFPKLQRRPLSSDEVNVQIYLVSCMTDNFLRLFQLIQFVLLFIVTVGAEILDNSPLTNCLLLVNKSPYLVCTSCCCCSCWWSRFIWHIRLLDNLDLFSSDMFVFRVVSGVHFQWEELLY